MAGEKVDRRGYVKYAAAGVVVVAVAGAGAYYATRPGPPPTTPTPTVTPTEKPTPTPTPTKPKEVIEVEWGIWSWGPELVQDNARIFNENNDDVQMRVGDYGLDTYASAIATSYAGGNPPDMHYSTPDITISYAHAGEIVDMEDYYPEIRKYLDDVIEGYRTGPINPITGKMYGLFYYAGGQAFIYNKRHMEEAGIGDEPPKTWDEVIDYSKKIKDAGIVEFPLGYFAGSWGFTETAIYGILLALAEEDPPYLWDEDLNPRFNEKGSALFNSVKAVADSIWVHKVSTPAVIEYTEPMTVDVMGSGKHSFIWMPDYDLAFVNAPGTSAEAGNLSYAIAPGPTGKIPSIYRTYVTPKATLEKGMDYLDAAWRMMQYAGGKTTNSKPDFENGEYFVCKRIFTQYGVAQPYKSIWDDPDVRAAQEAWTDPDLHFSVLERVYDFFNDPRMTPWWDPWFGYWLAGAVRPRIHSLWLGEQGKPPSDDTILGVMNDLADEWNTMKKEAGW